jgi:hypothetical protein
VVLRYTGWEACDDGEALIAALPDHGHRPGAVVADVTVVRTDEAVLPQRTLVELELLLLDQG